MKFSKPFVGNFIIYEAEKASFIIFLTIPFIFIIKEKYI